jgi:hypothetical protein
MRRRGLEPPRGNPPTRPSTSATAVMPVRYVHSTGETDATRTRPGSRSRSARVSGTTHRRDSPTAGSGVTATGPDCADIPGALSSTYQLTDDDVGGYVRPIAVASNASGTWEAAANRSALVLNLPPPNTAPPSIAGTPIVGHTLTATPGTWTHRPTFHYHWQRCNVAGCSADIPGADTSSHVVALADLGYRMRVFVGGFNDVGSEWFHRRKTAVVSPT